MRIVSFAPKTRVAASAVSPEVMRKLRRVVIFGKAPLPWWELILSSFRPSAIPNDSPVLVPQVRVRFLDVNLGYPTGSSRFRERGWWRVAHSIAFLCG